MLKPRDYQQKSIDNILNKFNNVDRLLYTLPTGGGKTIVFSLLANIWKDKVGGKVLILCHREELINQSCEVLSILGLTYQKILPSTKRVHSMCDVYVAMIETLDRRLKKNNEYLNDITLVIADECHVQVFNKVYSFFGKAKILGVTATPVLLGRHTFFRCKYCKSNYNEMTECCGEEVDEWSSPKKLSETYQDIVVGTTVAKLIELGSLVPEISFVSKNNLDGLKTDSSGDYTSKSLDQVYSTDEAVFNVELNYRELCKGKRTIIFNSSTKVNLKVYEDFKSKGYNVKFYDSVNKNYESRKQIVDWFRSEKDAILCNVGTFVAGLDVKEIECVILNLATKSLSKFIQIVGRGSRPSNEIMKQDFVLIDGGDNISEFGEWSSDRDWEDIFWNGLGKEKPKKIDIEDIQDCPNCGGLYPKKESTCPLCGFTIQPEEKTKQVKESIESTLVLEPIRKIPPPSGIHIYNYTKQQNENIHFAFRILQTRIVDMFKYWRVTKPKYLSAKQKGELDRKIKKHILKPYFHLIKQPDIQNGTHRTIEYLVNKTKDKLEKYYYGK